MNLTRASFALFRTAIIFALLALIFRPEDLTFILILSIATSLILEIIFQAMLNAENYYERKLKDMNSCYGVKCPDCEKYKKTCEGRDIWFIGSTKTKDS